MRICILNLLNDRFDETSVSGPLGGSETWAVRLAHSLSALGHGVTVVCACDPHTAADGVRWETYSAGGGEYDAVIASRLVSSSFSFISSAGIRAPKVFVQLHDEYAWGDDIRPDDLSDPRLRAVVCLTDWHAAHVAGKCGRPDLIRKIPNGIDLSEFPDIDVARRPGHYAVWSSCFSRGLCIASDVARLVRREVPDFRVVACTYSKSGLDLIGPDVAYAGALPKRELYSLMAGAGAWFYPSTYSETFCITAVENMYCGNAVVLAPRYGTTEFAGYCRPMERQFATDDRINFQDPAYYRAADPAGYARAVAEAAYRIVSELRRFESPESVAFRAGVRDEIARRFSWEAVARQWADLISEA